MKKKTPPVAAEVADMLRLTVAGSGNPNINELWRLTKDMEAMKLTVKFFGYELAKALLLSLPPLPPGGPFQMPMSSRAATQADLEASWCRYWSVQFRESHTIHRRAWEHAFVVQALTQLGRVKPGARGLGLGTSGPIASYLASKGCELIVADSHPPNADEMYRNGLLNRGDFDARVETRKADLGALPPDFRNFDFVWSVGRIQHAGSISRSIALVESLADTLKPGGAMVHTTEFSFAVDEQTIDNWGTVLFQRRHFEDMAARLSAKGCRVQPMDFGVGNRPLDRFIDVPPFEMPGASIKDWSRDAMHIKVNIDGFPCTSFGLVAVKNG